MARSDDKSSRRRREPILGPMWARFRRGDDWLPPDPPPLRVGPRRRKHPWLRFLARWTLVLALWAVVAATAATAYFAYDLPDTSSINKFERRPSLTFVAADGQAIGSYGDLYSGPVEIRDMAPHLVQAVLATEDRRFYSHFGLDPIGLARALWVNYRTGRVVQGGSTISQQLAKNVFLTPERSLHRKVQELLLAFWLERRFTKDQILAIYLNRVYLGGGTYGIAAAAQRYFGKRPSELSTIEAAVIAGLLKAPSRYAPTNDLAVARERGLEVIDNMVEAGILSPAEAEAAKRQPLRLGGVSPVARNGRYFTDWLVDQVSAFIGLIDRDLVVATTLDPRLQAVAERELVALLERDGPKAGVEQGALVAMAVDGAVRAMVGGRNYLESQFNRATAGLRQPGSAFKPFVYLAAVEAGARPDDRISDAPIAIGAWSPRNFDDRFYGEMALRDALARSVNTATVRLAQAIGIDRVVATARRMGIVSDMRRDFATALGASEVTLLELTAAYAPIANDGVGVLPYAIAEIRDAGGQVLYRRSGSGPGRVIGKPELAFITDMMTAVVQRGTGRAAALDRPAAGKTGTSQDYRDAWFIGFTADYVAGVWFGNDDSSPMERVTGGSLSARLWKAFMTEAHRGRRARPLPGQIPTAAVDAAPPPGPVPVLDWRGLPPLVPGAGAPTGEPREGATGGGRRF